MKHKAMDNHSMDVLSVIGCHQERNKNKGSRGESKSPWKGTRKCWKCGKVGNYKKDCRYKNVEKAKGSEDTHSTKAKNSSEGGDVYLASTSNASEHDTWLIDSGVSCHMTPRREWFCEYEKCWIFICLANTSVFHFIFITKAYKQDHWKKQYHNNNTNLSWEIKVWSSSFSSYVSPPLMRYTSESVCSRWGALHLYLYSSIHLS